jgi:hypothetical protein
MAAVFPPPGFRKANMGAKTSSSSRADAAARRQAASEFDAFGPIGFVTKFAADDWES